MICPKCGQEARNGRTVCALCGTPLKKERKKGPLILAGILLLILLAAAYWLLPRYLQPAPEETPEESAPAAPSPDPQPEETPDPADSPAPEELLWQDVDSLYAGYGYILGLGRDGTVRMAGAPDGGQSFDFSDWRDVKTLLPLRDAVYAVTREGRVLSTGRTAGTEAAADWENVDRIFFSAGALYGLTAEGQLYGAGPQLYYDASVYTDVQALFPTYADTLIRLSDGRLRIIPHMGFFSDEGMLYDVAQVAVNSEYALFRLDDGTVLPSTRYRRSMEYYGYPNPFPTWSGVTELALSDFCAFALTEDGHVLSAPLLPDTLCPDCSDWQGVKRIVLLTEPMDMLFGVTEDGRVLCAGASPLGSLPTDAWEGVAELQVNAAYTVGLREDGRVLWAAREDAPCPFDTEAWRGVKEIALGDHVLLGLRADGGVYMTGSFD
jgi:hypothetical protein